MAAMNVPTSPASLRRRIAEVVTLRRTGTVPRRSRGRRLTAASAGTVRGLARCRQRSERGGRRDPDQRLGGARRSRAGQPAGSGRSRAVDRPSRSGSTRPGPGRCCAPGIEAVELTQRPRRRLRDAALARPAREACYLRLTPGGVELAQLMDGTRTRGPAGRRLRPHLRPARARPGPPGRGRPGRQPDAGGAAGRRVPPAAAGAPPAVADPARPRAARRSRRAGGWWWPTSTRSSPFAVPGRRPAAVHPGRRGRSLGAVAVAGLGVFGWQWWRGEPVGVPDRRLLRRSARPCCSAST